MLYFIYCIFILQIHSIGRIIYIYIYTVYIQYIVQYTIYVYYIKSDYCATYLSTLRVIFFIDRSYVKTK